MLLVPAVAPKVSVALASPLRSVTDDGASSAPWPARAHVIVRPSMGTVSASVTFTTNGWASAALMTPNCASPLTIANAAGGPWLTLVLSLQESATSEAAAIIIAAAATVNVREVFGIIGTIR